MGDEYTTGFKSWNAEKRCVTFGRDSWTFGSATSYDYSDVCRYGDVTFCQTNQDTHDDPCGEGAHFQSPHYALIKTSFGWDRFTEPFFHYPLLQVIDWQGKETKWFQDYWAAVSRLHCPPTQLNCNLNQWASSGQVARCLRAIAA